MRDAVASGLLSVEEAITGYERMKAAGAFLPDIRQEFLSSSS